jgi:hypothetical protein
MQKDESVFIRVIRGQGSSREKTIVEIVAQAES